MANLTASQQISIADLMSSINRYRYNPSGIQRVILDHLQAVTEGAVDIVDPTNPFVFLLESSAVNTAVAVAESETNLRKQYPSLSQTEDEVYLHMSDKDFIDRFATPAKTSFNFLFQLTDLLSKLVDDPINECRRATILRDTYFTINGLVFSLQYPIQIRQYYNNVLQVTYDNTILTPLQDLTTNVIEKEIRRDANGVQWLFFSVDVSQFAITSTEYPVQASMYFKQTIEFTNQFYYCRVFNKSTATNNQWVEMQTTHTDQVYDPFTPTVVLKVLSKSMEVFIPPVYLNSGLIDGTVRVDVYTTQGAIDVNLSNSPIKAFSTTFHTVDEKRDVDAYSNALNNAIFVAYSEQWVVGGSSQITLSQLREQVVQNVVGSRQLPITNVQIPAAAEKMGFQLVRNVDNVTNRIFLANRPLPNPTNTNLITPANITIDTVIVNLEQLMALPEVKVNNQRVTLTSDLLYVNINGKISIYPQSQVSSLKNLLPGLLSSMVNKNTFLYSPYYYVLDNSLNEFEIRPYHLDEPTLSSLNFVSQNTTLDLQVNTQSYAIEKVSGGYKLLIIVKSDEFYQALDDKYVQAQLAFIPNGESNYAYLNATQVAITDAGERVFEFNIETNYDITSEDRLVLTNFKMFTNESLHVETALNQVFTLFYTTNSVTEGFIPDRANDLIGRFMLPADTAAITRETLKIQFGNSLAHLWSRCRSVAAGLDYQTYHVDVPYLYEEDVYDIDLTTGSMFTVEADGSLSYHVLHRKGEPVIDVNGDVVYKHRVGDVVLNEAGETIQKSSLRTDRHIDLLFIDGCYYFTTDTAYKTYRSEVGKIINTWVTRDLSALTSILLEQSKVYFYPKRSIGVVSVMLSNSILTSINAKQSFQLELYVNNSIYRDGRIREQLRRITIEILNSMIQQMTISISDIIVKLKAAYGESVISVKLSGLGGVSSYETVTLMNESDRLSLKKLLVGQEDGTLIVQEDVSISFIEYQTK